MDWSKAFTEATQPTYEDIASFIGSPLWGAMNEALKETYNAVPKMTYSGCSGQPGWNVKYQKSGKALCTLYPMDGFFIALVVIGHAQEAGLHDIYPTLSYYTRDLYDNTAFSLGGRWLMIQIRNEDVLKDALKLISLRVPPKKAKA